MTAEEALDAYIENTLVIVTDVRSRWYGLIGKIFNYNEQAEIALQIASKAEGSDRVVEVTADQLARFP